MSGIKGLRAEFIKLKAKVAPLEVIYLPPLSRYEDVKEVNVQKLNILKLELEDLAKEVPNPAFSSDSDWRDFLREIQAEIGRVDEFIRAYSPQVLVAGGSESPIFSDTSTSPETSVTASPAGSGKRFPDQATSSYADPDLNEGAAVNFRERGSEQIKANFLKGQNLPEFLVGEVWSYGRNFRKKNFELYRSTRGEITVEVLDKGWKQLRDVLDRVDFMDPENLKHFKASRKVYEKDLALYEEEKGLKSIFRTVYEGLVRSKYKSFKKKGLFKLHPAATSALETQTSPDAPVSPIRRNSSFHSVNTESGSDGDIFSHSSDQSRAGSFDLSSIRRNSSVHSFDSRLSSAPQVNASVLSTPAKRSWETEFKTAATKEAQRQIKAELVMAIISGKYQLDAKGLEIAKRIFGTHLNCKSISCFRGKTNTSLWLDSYLKFKQTGTSEHEAQSEAVESMTALYNKIIDPRVGKQVSNSESSSTAFASAVAQAMHKKNRTLSDSVFKRRSGLNPSDSYGIPDGSELGSSFSR